MLFCLFLSTCVAQTVYVCASNSCGLAKINSFQTLWSVTSSLQPHLCFLSAVGHATVMVVNAALWQTGGSIARKLFPCAHPATPSTRGLRQWRITGGVDWATARGCQHLESPQSLIRYKESNMWTMYNMLQKISSTTGTDKLALCALSLKLLSHWKT